MTDHHLTVDHGRCVGHGRCYGAFPDLFLEDAYGHSEPHEAELSASELADAQRAAANCPEGAIRIATGDR